MYTLGNDYDTTDAKEMTPFEQPPTGGYIFKVVGWSGDPSRSGRPMVTLDLEIAEGPHAGAFGKYPKAYRQMLDGESLPYFKAMIKYFGESNPEGKMREVIFTQKSGAKGFDPSKLMGMRVGGNLGEVEYVKQATGEVKVGTEVRFLGAVKDVPNMRPLPLKRLNGAAPAGRTQAPSAAKGSAAMADDDTVPF
jgi:hypothetical protein